MKSRAMVLEGWSTPALEISLTRDSTGLEPLLMLGPVRVDVRISSGGTDESTFPPPHVSLAVACCVRRFAVRQNHQTE